MMRLIVGYFVDHYLTDEACERLVGRVFFALERCVDLTATELDDRALAGLEKATDRQELARRLKAAVLDLIS